MKTHHLITFNTLPFIDVTTPIRAVCGITDVYNSLQNWFWVPAYFKRSHAADGVVCKTCATLLPMIELAEMEL